MQSLTAVKNVLFSLVNNIMGLLSGVVMSVIVARYLGPKNLGSYHLVTWAISMAMLIVNLGIGMSLMKHVAEYSGRKDHRSIAGLINFLMRMRISVAVAVTSVLIILSGTIAGYFNLPEARQYFIWAAIAILPTSLSEIFGASLTGIQKYHYSAGISLVMTPLSFALSLAVLMAGHGIIGLIVVSTVVSTVRSIINYWAARRENLLDWSVRLPSNVRSGITRFNLGVIAMNFLDAVVWQRSEVFFLGKFRTMPEVGFYSLAFSFTTTTVSFLANAISSVLIPIHSKAFGAGDHNGMEKIYQKSIQYLAMVSLPIAIGGAVLADRIILKLYGVEYLPTATAMSILFLSSAAGRIGGAFASVMYSSNMVHIKVYTALIWATVNITLDLLLIPRYGVMGAVIANSATQLMGVFTGPFIIYYLFRFVFPIAVFLRVLASSLTMGGAIWLLKGLFPGAVGLIALVVIGGVIYLIAVGLFRTVSMGDIEVLKQGGDRLPIFLQGRYRTMLSLVSRVAAR